MLSRDLTQVLTNHYCNFIFGQLQQLLKKKKTVNTKKCRKQKEKSHETVFRQTQLR